MSTLLVVFMAFCFGITVLQYAAMLLWAHLSSGLLERSRHGNRPLAYLRAAEDPTAPGVSIVMPAYNEELLIVDSVRSALSQRYRNLEVLVVNDGSRDRTLDVLVEAFDMAVFEVEPNADVLPTKRVHAVYRSRRHPGLVVVDKEAGGSKADAANAGINLATNPWVVIMDGDEFMERDVIARCMAEVIARPDDIVAVGTTLLPANDIVIDGVDVVDRRVGTNYWVGCQLIEYLTAFLVYRPGLSRLGALPIISGGFGLFRRDALLEIGGYRAGHLGEDMDLCLRIQRHEADLGRHYVIAQVPEALVWTEFPADRAVLRRQRIRWHRGLRQIMRDHGDMMVRRRYGRVGWLGVTTLYVFEWWGPIVEGIGYVLLAYLLATGGTDASRALSIFLAAQFFSMAMTALSVLIAVTRLDVYRRATDLRRLLGFLVASAWGFRQITLVWRLWSLRGPDEGWGEMTRRGLAAAEATR